MSVVNWGLGVYLPWVSMGTESEVLKLRFALYFSPHSEWVSKNDYTRRLKTRATKRRSLNWTNVLSEDAETVLSHRPNTETLVTCSTAEEQQRTTCHPAVLWLVARQTWICQMTVVGGTTGRSLCVQFASRRNVNAICRCDCDDDRQSSGMSWYKHRRTERVSERGNSSIYSWLRCPTWMAFKLCVYVVHVYSYTESTWSGILQQSASQNVLL